MPLFPAVETDFPAIIAHINIAYRGTGSGASWDSEDGIVGDQRLDLALLHEDERFGKPLGDDLHFVVLDKSVQGSTD